MPATVTDSTSALLAGILGDSISDKIPPNLKSELVKLHRAFFEMAALIDRINNNPLTYFTPNVGYSIFLQDMTEIDVYCPNAIPVNAGVELYNNGGTLAARSTLGSTRHIDAIALEAVAAGTVGRFTLLGLIVFDPPGGIDWRDARYIIECTSCSSNYMTAYPLTSSFPPSANDYVGYCIEYLNTDNVLGFFNPMKA